MNCFFAWTLQCENEIVGTRGVFTCWKRGSIHMDGASGKGRLLRSMVVRVSCIRPSWACEGFNRHLHLITLLIEAEVILKSFCDIFNRPSYADGPAGFGPWPAALPAIFEHTYTPWALRLGWMVWNRTKHFSQVANIRIWRILWFILVDKSIIKLDNMFKNY